MGGRGGASGLTANSAGGQKDLQHLSDYMAKSYGIQVKPETAQADFNALRDVAQGMERVLKEFPQMLGIVSELNADEKRGNAYASAHFNGKLQINISKYKDLAALERSYQADVKSEFHPAGSAKSISVHEMGHLVERALLQRAYNNYAERAINWNKNREATRVIGAAAKAVKRTPTGKGSSVNQLVRQVSRYATKNRSEALAECVADYVSNGSSAKPLSQEVWKILKKELG